MDERTLYDITEVCKMLNTTSRTLRFYEEKGIISSTTIGISSRRQYTDEQVAHIRNVLVLRTLGLTLKEITNLQKEETNLRSAVLSKRAEIYASIHTRIHEINFLNEALCALESGKNLFEDDWHSHAEAGPKEFEIAKLCTSAICENHDETLYTHLSPRLIQYMPMDVFKAVRNDAMAPLGEFIAFEQIISDECYPNKLYSRIRYSNIVFLITFVFHGGMIDGLWLGYQEAPRENCL
jgi:DNA-binding transcriptional MerR regulator